MVGLPTKDPWSLPFGYKTIFGERMSQYDLFIYSEDDTLITERNIDAFVKVTKILPEEYIAGFIRHEISETGRSIIRPFILTTIGIQIPFRKSASISSLITPMNIRRVLS